MRDILKVLCEFLIESLNSQGTQHKIPCPNPISNVQNKEPVAVLCFAHFHFLSM